MRLANKVALVTGAGSGIGRATATFFGREGARVLAADIDEATAAETAGQIVAAGGVARAIRADVGQAADRRRLIDTVVERYGALHVLMNNRPGRGRCRRWIWRRRTGTAPSTPASSRSTSARGTPSRA